MHGDESASLHVGVASGGRQWTARMVRPLADQGVGQQASFLRKVVRLDSACADAVLRISALGLYRCFINGVRVGADQLTPGWTCYNDRLSYQTYAVGALLRVGDNTIDIWLGDGWYRSTLMWAANPITNTWGSEIAAIAEITAGDRLLAATDSSWRSGLLPVL